MSDNPEGCFRPRFSGIVNGTKHIGSEVDSIEFGAGTSYFTPDPMISGLQGDIIDPMVSENISVGAAILEEFVTDFCSKDLTDLQEMCLESNLEN